MRWLYSLSLLCATLTAVSSQSSSSPSPDSDTVLRITTISFQAVGGSEPIHRMAEIQYDPSTLDVEITSYEAPDLSEETELVRLGASDTTGTQWTTSTSVTSSQSFSKGYRPTFILSLDAEGGVLGVACRSSRVDAGQTRDFGPKVKLVPTTVGVAPQLNRPVVLKEGKVGEEVPEKTMLQKYWWVAAAAVLLLVTSGGGDK